MDLLKGSVDITDNLNYIKDLIYHPISNLLIINLADQEVDLKGDNVLGGGCLLPPPEAVVAELDGDEESYDIIYQYHMTDPYVVQYITGLITYLYNGGSLVLYYPSLDVRESVTIPKMLNFLYGIYGIGVGIVGRQPGLYNPRFEPVWLNMLYSANVIGCWDFIRLFPIGADVSPSVMDRLINEIRPFDSKHEQRVEHIKKLIAISKGEKPVKEAIFQI